MIKAELRVELNRLFLLIVKFFATGGYIGFMPYMPGTFGTLLGVMLFLFIYSSFFLYVLVSVFLVLFGIWISSVAEREIFKVKDSPEIVIDEVVGFLIAMAFIGDINFFSVITGFILFRAFDILKPYPIKRIQNIGGGLGIMIDDIIAGIYSNILLRLVLFIVSYLFK